jgi:hypothetical protein
MPLIHGKCVHSMKSLLNRVNEVLHYIDQLARVSFSFLVVGLLTYCVMERIKRESVCWEDALRTPQQYGE